MTVAGFIFLLVAAIVGLTVGAHFAEGFAPPGLQRTFAVAIITAAILFPAARLAGCLGWIRGGLNMGDDAGKPDAAASGGTENAIAGGKDAGARS